jgi:hypothetical protein
MSYQTIRSAHIAGNPPGADPQRYQESFTQYKYRMSVLGLLPDIEADESDADYETRLATYAVTPPTDNITASYAILAESAYNQLSPEISCSFASRSMFSNRAVIATSSITATSASWATNSFFATSASFATIAMNAPPSDTASFLNGERAVLDSTTVTNLTITNTAQTAVDVRCSTSGIGIYSQANLTEAVFGAQSGLMGGNINRAVIRAYRDYSSLNNYDTTASVLIAEDNDLTGSAGLFDCITNGTTVFHVDKTGSLWSSGSKGYTGTVMFAGPVTMAFQGGILTTVS